MRELGYTHAKIPTQTTTWLEKENAGICIFISEIYNFINYRKFSEKWYHIVTLDSFAAAGIDDIISRPTKQNK